MIPEHNEIEMLKLVVCVIILVAVCCAQEHLTCLRTGDVLTQQSPETLQRTLQGPPGKRGAKGPVGSRGKPGQKGEPGILDDRQIILLQDRYDSLSQEIEALKNQSKENQQNELTNSLFQKVAPLKNQSKENQQNKLINSLAQEVAALKNQTRENQQNELINSLSQEVEALRNQSRMNRQLVVDVFSRGLYVPPHVYIYRLTPGRQSWQKSQEFCQSWGGDLAMHGVKTLENRKKLIQLLPTNDFYVWIGASDIASEGNWTWINGERASSSELIWLSGEPNNNGGDEDCVVVTGYLISSIVGLAYDIPCAFSYQALCEKQI